MSTLRIEYPKWAEKYHQPARYKGAHGGRGSSKSHTFATKIVEEHIFDPDTKSVCLREIQRSIKMSSKALIEDKIKALGVGGLFNAQQDGIKRVDGNGIIIFNGLQDHTADSIKSLEGFDRAWTEEAQSISATSLKKLRPTIRKPNSELWFTWNPEDPTDPVDELFRGETPPDDMVCQQINYTDNPWFPDVLEEERLFDLKRDPELYRHVWEGEYLIVSRATVFNNYRVEEFEAPKDAVFRFGLDLGYAQDPTALIRCFMVGRTLYIDYEAVSVGCPIQETPELLLTIPQSEKWPIVGDSSRPETLRHLRDNGFPKIMASVKGAGSVADGVEFLRSFDIVVHPRCVRTIDELKRYRYKVDPHTDAILPIFEDKNNHIIDALRYSLEAVRRTGKAKKVIKSSPIPVSNHWN